MSENIQIESILAILREQIGAQAQEIAVLRAALASYQQAAALQEPTETE